MQHFWIVWYYLYPLFHQDERLTIEWHSLINLAKVTQQSDGSVNTRHFDMCASLSEWTSVLKLSSLPIQTITWSFPWPCCLCAGTNKLFRLSRVLFPVGIFLFCSTIPLFEHMQTSCWIHGLHLPLLMTMRGILLWNPPWWQQRWYVVEALPTWNYFLSWG